jgi:mxaJ protein
MSRILVACTALAAAIMLVPSATLAERQAFRVCADPNNLPFSHRNGRGFENRLAELWADRLGLEVEYTWFPQRLGFVRNTLRAKTEDGEYKCDVVMGMVTGYELLVTTKPYYRSTYALVYVKGRGLDDIRSSDDFVKLEEARRAELKIGAFDRTPGAAWLARHGFGRQVVPFPAMSGDPANYPGEAVEKALVDGQLDAVVIWGPIAGYFARQAEGHELEILPLESIPGIRFDFPISVGVRHGDSAGKAEIEQLIDETSAEIEALLADYNVPMLELGDYVERDDDDD